jgi:hypothetical protein
MQYGTHYILFLTFESCFRAEGEPATLSASSSSERRVIWICRRALPGHVRSNKSWTAFSVVRIATTKTLRDLMAGPPELDKRLALRAEIRRIIKRIDITFEVAETAKERKEREEMEATAAMFKNAGGKILMSADGVVPKRSFTIVFAHCRGRRGSQPMVYEADEQGTNFSAAVMLLPPAKPLPKAEMEAQRIKLAAGEKARKTE